MKKKVKKVSKRKVKREKDIIAKVSLNKCSIAAIKIQVILNELPKVERMVVIDTLNVADLSNRIREMNQSNLASGLEEFKELLSSISKK